MESFRILLINSYFPTDPRSDFDEIDLLMLLTEIQKIIDDNDFDYMVLGGDINADFRRKTKFVDIIHEFLMKTKVHKSWDSYPAEFTHVMEKDGVTHRSTIDHFFWNSLFSDLIEDAGVLHLPENVGSLSDILQIQITCLLKKDLQPNSMQSDTYHLGGMQGIWKKTVFPKNWQRDLIT